MVKSNFTFDGRLFLQYLCFASKQIVLQAFPKKMFFKSGSFRIYRKLFFFAKE